MRLIVAEGKPFMREVIGMACQFTGHEVLMSTDRGRAALQDLLRLGPEVLLLDLCLPDMGGFDVITEAARIAPAVRIVVFSACTTPYVVARIRNCAVTAYLDQNTSTFDQFRAALTAVQAGDRYHADSYSKIAADLDNDTRRFDRILSNREWSVLEHMGDGLSDPEIARALGVSPRTVESHRASMERKLGLATKMELERYARANGFTRAFDSAD